MSITSNEDNQQMSIISNEDREVENFNFLFNSLYYPIKEEVRGHKYIGGSNKYRATQT
jgi:hypothetical protein